MHFVIDSNEYIFAFGPDEESKARVFLDKLIDKANLHTIFIPRAIFEEVKRNLSIEAFKEFNTFVHFITNVDEDIVVPFEIVFEYENKGLKPIDAFIAAYTEYKNADVLITENRHFLSRQSNLPFKVLSVEKCLNLV